MLYLAIDQHRKQLTVNIRNEEGDVIEKRQVSTEWKRVRAFFARLRDEAEPEGGFVAILEICGFNDWLLEMLDEYGCRETVLIQPEKRSKKKTDRRDADALGELLWVNRSRLLQGKSVHQVRRVLPPTTQERQDRQLTASRKRLTQLRTRAINRVQHILMRHNLQQECPTKGIQTIKAKKWLSELELDSMDRLEMNQLLAQWAMHDMQLDGVNVRIEERQNEDEVASIVASIPGMGAYSSLAVACRIGPIGRFPRAKSLANYWGLTPGCRNSGEVTDRLGSITKQGSAMVRYILGQLVMRLLRHDPYLKQWYQRIKKRRGSKIARVAVMRRVAEIIWHMVKYKQAYVTGGPEAWKKVYGAGS